MSATSIYIALKPPPALAAVLAIPGGHTPETIHLTLAYLGHTEDYTPAELKLLQAAIASFAANQSALAGSITKSGSFAPSIDSRGRGVLYRAVEIDGLAQMRAGLVAHLALSGFVPASDLSFVPHLTLAYFAPGFLFPLPSPPLPWVASTLTLFVGAKEIALPLQEPPSLDSPKLL